MSEPIEHEPSPELTAMLDALAQPARPDELEGGAEAIAAMRAVLAPAGITAAARVRRSRHRARLAAVATAGAILAGGAAAAAAGFNPIDRPPAVDAPETSVPPAALAASTDGPQEDAATTSAPTTITPDLDPTTTVEATTAQAAEAAPAPSADEAAAGADAVTCADGSHGKTVSSVAHDTPPGPDHGAAVAAAAQSDCGKADAATPSSEPGSAATPNGRAQATHGRAGQGGPPPGVPGNTAPGRAHAGSARAGGGNGAGRGATTGQGAHGG
jgi:hypothetical protein